MRFLAGTLLALCFAAPASLADLGYDVYLIGGTGFAYEYDALLDGPDPQPDTLLAIGDGLVAVGWITATNLCYLNVSDYNTNEYTFFVDGLQVESWITHPGFGLEIHFAPGGRFRVFRDAFATGSLATLGTYPPNATTPASFADGTLVLGGTLTYAVCFYQWSNQILHLSANVTWNEGDLLQGIPVNVRPGLFGSEMRLATATSPEGFLAPFIFESRVDQECSAVPARARTWGRLKALYR